jgi:hypothetical protein
MPSSAHARFALLFKVACYAGGGFLGGFVIGVVLGSWFGPVGAHVGATLGAACGGALGTIAGGSRAPARNFRSAA